MDLIFNNNVLFVKLIDCDLYNGEISFSYRYCLSVDSFIEDEFCLYIENKEMQVSNPYGKTIYLYGYDEDEDEVDEDGNTFQHIAKGELRNEDLASDIYEYLESDDFACKLLTFVSEKVKFDAEVFKWKVA